MGDTSDAAHECMRGRARARVFTLTRPALWVEDEAAVTGAGKRTGDVGAQLLTVTIPALINICSRRGERKEQKALFA